MAYSLDFSKFIYHAAAGSAIGAALNVFINKVPVNALMFPAIASTAGAMAGLWNGMSGSFNQATTYSAVGSAAGAYLVTRNAPVSLAFAAGTAAYGYYKFSTPISTQPTAQISV